MGTLSFSTLRDDMLAMLVCATRWLSMHLYTLAYMFMHESCLLVCHPCFNTMMLWTSDPNLHLSLADTTLVCLFVCYLALFPFFLTSYVCHVNHVYLIYSSLLCSLRLFLPWLVYWFLVFAFACTHMEWGCLELGHGLPGTNKRGEDVITWIWAKWLRLVGLGV